MLSGKKAEHFKQLLETRISELNRVLATAEQETRASAARHADPADQAAAECGSRFGRQGGLRGPAAGCGLSHFPYSRRRPK